MSSDNHPITMLSYKTGSPSYREGEFTLSVGPDGQARLLHRAFIQERNWTARLEPNVWEEFLSLFRSSCISSNTHLKRTVEPGTLISRATWKQGDTTQTAVVDKSPAELAFKKLAHQIIDQLAPGLMDLGPWQTDRRLLESSEELGSRVHGSE